METESEFIPKSNEEIKEIEITPDMIRAGLNGYARWDRRVEETEGLVTEIYQAMESVRRGKIRPR